VAEIAGEVFDLQDGGSGGLQRAKSARQPVREPRLRAGADVENDLEYWVDLILIELVSYM
jgi:hypothetical protein